MAVHVAAAAVTVLHTTTQAVVRRNYGPPEVLRLERVPMPVAADDGVVIEVQAVSLNPFDWHQLRGEPFLMRLAEGGLRKPRHPGLGIDLAGRVHAVGCRVTRFKPGDAVWGMANQGALAGHASALEDDVVLKPQGLSFAQAAAVPTAALTALQALRSKGQVQPGHRVLINGASGGVGSFAVQIAKSMGAEVTGVCSTANAVRVRALGADHVIDYSREDFANDGQRYDLVVDMVGNRPAADCARVLRPQGRWVQVGFTSLGIVVRVLAMGRWLALTGGRKMGLMMARRNQGDLLQLNALLASGQVVPLIDRLYPIDATAQALHYLEAGHASGKVVVTLEEGSAG